VYDIEETLLEHHHQWMTIIDRRTPKAEKKKILYEMYKNVDVTCDLPGFFYWELILEVFPECKLIFFERPVDQWYTTLHKTVTDYTSIGHSFPDFIANPLNRIFLPTGYYITQCLHCIDPMYLGHQGFGMDCFGNKKVVDEVCAKRQYMSHNANVKLNAPKDKLLILRSFDDFSWKVICDFTGTKVPEGGLPFPNENKSMPGELTKIVDQLLVSGGDTDGQGLKRPASIVDVVTAELKFRGGVFFALCLGAVFNQNRQAIQGFVSKLF